jgi:hypothetical protein
VRQTITSITLHYDTDNPIFGESNTIVSLQDEAAGLFIEVSQIGSGTGSGGTLRFDRGNLEMIVEIANKLLNQFTDN